MAQQYRFEGESRCFSPASQILLAFFQVHQRLNCLNQPEIQSDWPAQGNSPAAMLAQQWLLLSSSAFCGYTKSCPAAELCEMAESLDSSDRRLC